MSALTEAPEEIIEQQKLDAAKLNQNGGVPAVVRLRRCLPL